MIWMYLLCLLLWPIYNTQLPIRTGIKQMYVGNVANASYSIPFKTSLPDPVYNSLVTISYIQNFNNNRDTGINITSTCLAFTQSNMNCRISSTITDQYSIVYMSYVVSDHGSLAVGNYAKTFNLISTGINQEIVFQSNINKKYINESNALYLKLYVFISGISSLDEDFSLNIIGDPKFDAINGNISFDITMREVYVKNLTIVFGYILYDTIIITVSLYEQLKLIPGSVAQGFLYGIKNVKSNNSGIPRLLQATALSSYSAPTPILVNDAANISPIIVTYPKNKTNVNQSLIDRFTPNPQSLTAKLLRSGPTGISQLNFRNVDLNPAVFSSVAQQDGVIDTNPGIYSALVALGLFQTSSSKIKNPGVMHRAISKRSHANNVDADLFNKLFTTNGFVIMTEASDIDQIYFYQVTLKDNYIPQTSFGSSSFMRSPPSPIFMKSTVTNKKPAITCLMYGKIVAIQEQIDYLQKQIVLKCVYCSPGTYVSPITKKCAPNPKKPAAAPPVTASGSKGVVRSNP